MQKWNALWIRLKLLDELQSFLDFLLLTYFHYLCAFYRCFYYYYFASIKNNFLKSLKSQMQNLFTQFSLNFYIFDLYKLVATKAWFVSFWTRYFLKLILHQRRKSTVHIWFQVISFVNFSTQTNTFFLCFKFNFYCLASIRRFEENCHLVNWL